MSGFDGVRSVGMVVGLRLDGRLCRVSVLDYGNNILPEGNLADDITP